ncbi:tRNA (5-methylaminomethyl-2-thiouridine)(34)-methyltransferase MnmD [Shewanella litorisediminis]|uniref:tRNA (5-methylaminomethyl-2-thiouridine)(34)-methyltransferase MnmD n=1 Tax=Shewanella litorisediminis TaxID=1173586 RepID=A0ABX7G1V7_9GAMM|nr:tRNA (5-methylaminomethyl-2-thiouridine)(34)-methyltransferase MnmD [Shewanella litorisediminis]MCL2918490.1 tRNA (5-methylaminomethyl-2-thiouridine)(34)-methyltransferase MnmD [Shewanella litorisediminis]QRH01322.1 tRNA (5-methylaminomethyl-2-thiouridine)(34)-methyltransferase MnmD [Shewanella litorisediminis]
MNIKLEVTADGSHTLVNSLLDESYHVFKGALTESVYVYIEAGLVPMAARKRTLRILEVGFGTGLNVLLTQQKAGALELETHFTTLEPFPLDDDIVAALNYVDCLAALGGYGDRHTLARRFSALHQAPWDSETELHRFRLHKIRSRLEEQRFSPESFDLIYFDAFAPAKQPELWAAENFINLFNALSPEGLLVSYCANGQFKRDLKAAGFRVESYPGPMGRRHMTRAWKDSVSSLSLT